MAFDPVPLAIGNGALHTDDVWRVAANAFSSDSQGIILPGQMKVTALGTPGPAVVIGTGGVIVRLGTGQGSGQSYVGRASTATQVPIAPNNTGSVVRHLIIARIIDPDFAPWQPSGSPGAPNVDVATGPYFEPFVVSGVAANTTRASQVVSYAAVALARVDVPANTTNVTQAMIVDCRELAQPRVAFAYDVQQNGSQQDLSGTLNAWHTFPTNSLQVYVPRWATHAQVTVDFTSVLYSAPGIVGEARISFGGTLGPTTTMDLNIAGGVERYPLLVAAEFNVTAVQDTMAALLTQMRRTQYTGVVRVDTRTQIRYDVRFSERVI